MLAYFTPVIGAIIADSWLGKFRTILYLSILYACGGIILSLGAFPNKLDIMKLISLIGLFIIGLGTGGIKPCVSAFGGDQFQEGQEDLLKRFFSIFYMAISLGSLFSTFLTPILREDVHCLGEKTCFPIAFGVPSILMIIALLFFVCGKPLYIFRPPEGNIVLKVSKCICYAIKRKSQSSEKKKSHWLDYADDNYDKDLIKDIKILFHVLVLYIPLPIFWALFDQQGSRWTLQATRMDGSVRGYHIKADQMQVINPLLIIAFIPLFDYVVYPILKKCKLLQKPLQRITTGGILAAISFMIAGLIELNLESAYPVMPSPGQSELTIINNSPCSVNIEERNLTKIDAFETGVIKEIVLNEIYSWKFVPENCNLTSVPTDFTFNATSQIGSMMITFQNEQLAVFMNDDSKTKSKNGEPKVRLFYNIEPPKSGNISFKLVKEHNDQAHYIYAKTVGSEGVTEYSSFPPGRYKIFLPVDETNYQETPVYEEDFKSGGIYIISIYNKEDGSKKISSTYEMVKGNFLSILFQIPQYVIITAGEIMFSITGLEFSYSQSPTSMKSVVQAVWLLTVAFGNLIVLVIAKLHLFDKQSHELFLFAVLMAVDMIIFAILAFYYKYVTINLSSERIKVSSPKGRSNEAYTEETDFTK